MLIEVKLAYSVVIDGRVICTLPTSEQAHDFRKVLLCAEAVANSDAQSTEECIRIANEKLKEIERENN